MSKRKPLQIMREQDLNKLKGSSKQDSKKDNNMNKKVIKVKKEKVTKLLTPKKITIITANKSPQKEEIKKLAHVDSNKEKIHEKENLSVNTIENNIQVKPEIFLAQEIKQRNVYTLKQLLELEPKNCPPPINYHEFPEILRTGGITQKKKAKSNWKNLQKRSPAGETGTKKIEIANIEKPIEPQKIEPQKIEPIVPELEILPIDTNKEKRRLEQRQKQIDLGKKTLSYFLYCKKVPIYERKKGHPVTPRKNQICSKRSWDGQVRKWRRMLHEYDPKTEEEINEAYKLYPEETSLLISQRTGKVNLMEFNDVFN